MFSSNLITWKFKSISKPKSQIKKNMRFWENGSVMAAVFQTLQIPR